MKWLQFFTLVMSWVLSQPIFASENLQLRPFDLKAIDKSIQQKVSNQRIVLIGETHQSQASFEKQGLAFLASLQKKGFDCLFLERGQATFQPFYDQFNQGQTFESSVFLAHAELSKQVGVVSALFEEQLTLEYARHLGYKVYAMDFDMTDHRKRIFQETLLRGETAEWLHDENQRNYRMATEITRSLNSRECRRILGVVGASHLFRTQVAGPASLISIPQILKESGWDHVLFRFLDGNSSRELNLRIYDSIFFQK